MHQLTPFVVAVYLLLLPVIGLIARARAKEQSLRDFYLAGGTLGVVPLLFTLYATQYSGNTLLGFAGNAYRTGFISIFSAAGMSAAVLLWLVIGRRLNDISRVRGYITTNDFFADRFANKTLSWTSNIILILVLCSYILTNFKAIGLLIVAITNGGIPMIWGVFIMAFAMALYESLGGMRSVVLTDMLQGSLLLAGCIAGFSALMIYFGSVGDLFTELTRHSNPDWPPPDAALWRNGFSIIVLFGLSISLYPHAMQRIYAARNWPVLRKSLIFMLFLPLFTTLPIVITAMSAWLIMPDIPAEQTDQIIPLLLAQFSMTLPGMSILTALFMAAAIAAIMSTIDSALLSIGAAVTKDFAKPLFPAATEKHLTRLSKILSWILMMLMAGGAVILPQSIWTLIIIKLEILIQLAPAFIFGILLPGVRGGPVLAGFLLGLIVTVWLKFGAIFGLPLPPLYNIHAGIYGLAANLALLALLQKTGTYRTARTEQAERAEQTI